MQQQQQQKQQQKLLQTETQVFITSHNNTILHTSTVTVSRIVQQQKQACINHKNAIFWDMRAI
jgi:hypothetical protein